MLVKRIGTCLTAAKNFKQITMETYHIGMC